jgi:hypothetical protein
MGDGRWERREKKSLTGDAGKTGVAQNKSSETRVKKQII